MNMKLVKYMLIAILVLGTGEVAAQVQVERSRPRKGLT